MKKIFGTPKEYLCLILGNLGYAIAFDIFFAGNNIASGGFSGLGLVINHFLPIISVGTVVLVLSVPMFIWSYFVQGAKYTLSALISTVVLSFLIDRLAFLPSVTDNRFLSAICGGAMFGFSATILIRGRVSGSGTDLLARLLVTKFRSMSLGTFLMVCDAFVVALSVLAFGDIESGIYSAISIIVSSSVMDYVVKGVNKATMFLVITDTPAKVLSEKIYERLQRGVTLIPAKGMYSGKERNMLLVVVGRRQIYDMKDVIKEAAPDSFVMMLSVSEILGEGFRGIDVTVPIKELDNKDK
jgi:uncharacterized membrane-anchored protein YitT (DUF2179 family)